MPAREKNPGLAPQSSFAPLGQAVMETFNEGVVVFDTYGRMLYANQRARRAIDALGDGVTHRGENLRDRLVTFGGRARALKQGSVELGEVVFLPDGEHSPTLAERERQASGLVGRDDFADDLRRQRSRFAQHACGKVYVEARPRRRRAGSSQ